MSAILPGATIGILGGGQLGRMTAMAARSLGYRVQVMDPDPSCPARFVVDACFEGSWDDAKAAADLARGCDVVTLEIEQLSLDSLRAAQRYAPVRPGEAVLAIIQDRIAQKEWLAARQFPIGPFRSIRSLDNLRAALDVFGHAGTGPQIRGKSSCLRALEQMFFQPLALCRAQLTRPAAGRHRPQGRSAAKVQIVLPSPHATRIDVHRPRHFRLSKSLFHQRDGMLPLALQLFWTAFGADSSPPSNKDSIGHYLCSNQ